MGLLLNIGRPLKKCFFRSGKKTEIRPGTAGSVRNGLKWDWDSSPITLDTFLQKNYVPIMIFGKNIGGQKGVDYFETARYVANSIA